MDLEAKLACLKVVQLDRVRLHEDVDPWRVKRLTVSMRHQGVLRNPLIVNGCGQTYNVMDGATRASALSEMGIPHVVVQEVSYADPQICLSRWHHVVVGLPSSRLLYQFESIPNLSLNRCKPDELMRQVSLRQSLFGLITNEARAFSFSGSAWIENHVGLLNQVVEIYRGKAEVHRTAETSFPTLISQYPDLNAVVVFPLFTPDEVMHFSLNETKLPMGITRHIIGGRALGLNVPLDLLTSDQTLDEKEAWLRDLIRRRLRRHQVRVYEEPTIVFDE